MRAYFLIRSMVVPALVVLAVFWVDASAQQKKNGTAEVFGVVKGADGASRHAASAGPR
jgi:hypothetical protein